MGFKLLHMALLSFSCGLVSRYPDANQGGGTVRVGVPGKGTGEHRAPRTARQNLACMCNQRTKKWPLYGGRPPFLRYANTGAAFAAT